MQEHELYRRILGIEAPWYVDAVGEAELAPDASNVRAAARLTIGLGDIPAEIAFEAGCSICIEHRRGSTGGRGCGMPPSGQGLDESRG